MKPFRKNVNDLSIDECLEELRVIAQLKAKQSSGDLRKRKDTLRAKIKLASKAGSHC